MASTVVERGLPPNSSVRGVDMKRGITSSRAITCRRRWDLVQYPTNAQVLGLAGEKDFFIFFGE